MMHEDFYEDDKPLRWPVPEWRKVPLSQRAASGELYWEFLGAVPEWRKVPLSQLAASSELYWKCLGEMIRGPDFDLFRNLSPPYAEAFVAAGARGRERLDRAAYERACRQIRSSPRGAAAWCADWRDAADILLGSPDGRPRRAYRDKHRQYELDCYMEPLYRALCPQWSPHALHRLRWADVAALARGTKTPADLAPGLTSKEAHMWLLSDGSAYAWDWLAAHLGVPEHRSIPMIRWLARHEIRSDTDPRLAVPLDELQDEDIRRPSDPPELVCRRARRRMAEETGADAASGRD